MNYIGSKYSLMGFIKDTVSELTSCIDGDGLVFADIFAGTGIVGSEFRKMGFEVISNDMQYYSYVMNRHLIENSAGLNDKLFDTLNVLDGIDGFISQNYCAGSGGERNYFSPGNGKKCDAIRTKLEELRNNGAIDEDTYFYYLASLIDSIDKYANTASVYGAYLKHIKKSAQKEFKLEPLPIISGPKGKVYNEPAEELIKHITGDILYMDPPYNARQYAANYHVLETIAKYDNPLLSGKTGLRDYSSQKSSFCSKSSVKASFESIIKNADFKYVLLSYNNEGLMSFDDIKAIMTKYGVYSCFTKEYRRFKADKDTNRSIAGNTTTEYIHCLQKK